MRVRVSPDGAPPIEAVMKAGLTRTHVLAPGVRVLVSCEAGTRGDVRLDDDPQAILERNRQLQRRE